MHAFKCKIAKLILGEVIRIVIDLINLSPSVPLNGDIPQRVWTGKDISYKHLKVFSCKTFVHIPRDEKNKLDGKSKECIFLVYPHEEFNYRLWDPVDKKIIKSRYVIFFEDQTIEDIKKKVEIKQIKEYPVNLDPVPLPVSQNEGGALP